MATGRLTYINIMDSTTEHAHEEEHIHMPPPSWAPVVLALGMALIGFGIVWIAEVPGVAAVGFGILLLLVGLVRWIYEDIRTVAEPH